MTTNQPEREDTISIDSTRYYQFLLMHLGRYQRESRVADYRTLVPGLRHRKRVQSVLQQALKHTPDTGPVLEFGVYRGRTIRFLADLLPNTSLYGFDSFEGFPDDGRRDWNQDFRVETIPQVPGNVNLIKGFFDKSLPAFLANNPHLASPRLIHIDCDLYSSTKTIFQQIGHLLGPGNVIVFDELIHYHRFLENEFLAFYQFLEERKLSFKWLARSGKLLPFNRFLALKAEGKLPPSIESFRAQGYHQNAAIILSDRDREYEDSLCRFHDKAKRLAELYPLKLDAVHESG